MNQRGNYISKGVYLHPQIPGFVAVKQYIFCRQNEKKCLILKFSNNCDFKLSAMSFTVVQLDAAGEVIGETPVSYNALSVSQGCDFSVNSGIIVEERCCDFKIVFNEVFSGYFKYVIRGGEIVAYYEKRGELTVEGEKKRSDFIPAFFAKERKTKTRGRAYLVAVLAVLAVLFLNVLNIMMNMQGAIDAGPQNGGRPSDIESPNNSYTTHGPVEEITLPGTYAPNYEGVIDPDQYTE